MRSRRLQRQQMRQPLGRYGVKRRRVIIQHRQRAIFRLLQRLTRILAEGVQTNKRRSKNFD